MVVYLLCYAAAFLLERSGFYLLSGAGLVAAAVYLYRKDYAASGNMLHLRAIYSLAWVGGQGLACMKLSRLSTVWSVWTWLSFLAAYVGFYLTFGFLEKGDHSLVRMSSRRPNLERTAPSFFFCA